MYILKIKITKYRPYILLIIKYYPITDLIFLFLFYPWFWLLFYPWFWLLFYPWLAGTLHIEPEYDRCVFFLRIHVQNSLKQYFIPCLNRTFCLLLKATILGWAAKASPVSKQVWRNIDPPPPYSKGVLRKGLNVLSIHQ